MEPGRRDAPPRGDLVWLWDPRAASVVWMNAAAERLCGARRLAMFSQTAKLEAGVERPAALEGAEGPVAGALGCERAALADGEGGWRMRLTRHAPAPEERALKAAVFDLASAPLAAADASGRILVSNAAFAARSGARAFAPATLSAGRSSEASGRFAARAAAEPRSGRAFWLIEANAARPGTVSTEALAKIAHEFRSPLTAVLGFAEFLREAAEALPPERLRDYLDDLRAAAERMRGLADALVALGAAAQEGGAAPSLDGVVERAARLAAPAAERRGARLESAASTELGLLGDAEALGRAVSNLIDNALKYGGNGVRIVAEARDLGPLEGAALTVADDGPGLDAAALAEARRAWGRPGARAASEAAGGLGLALVAEIAADHGGRLEIDTAPGEGFRASIRLPPGRLLRTPAPAE